MIRRLLCSIIFFFLLHPVSAQKDYHCGGTGPMYGRFFPQQHSPFPSGEQFIGYQCSGYFGFFGTPIVPGTAYCGVFIRQRFESSTEGAMKMQGYIFHTPLAGVQLFDRKDWFDLVGEFGLTAGRWRMADANSKSTNPFWCPTLAVQPRFMIGPVLLSFRLEYDYDVSNSAWKVKSGAAHLPALHQSGFYPSVMIGLGD